MDLDLWSLAAPMIGVTFLASLVEAVEAFTVVLAVAADEMAVFAAKTAELTTGDPKQRPLQWIAGLTAFKAVLLEGIEVAFIVLSVGPALDLPLPASARPHRDTRDSRCSPKLFPGGIFLALPAFARLHRFLPALLRPCSRQALPCAS